MIISCHRLLVFFVCAMSLLRFAPSIVPCNVVSSYYIRREPSRAVVYRTVYDIVRCVCLLYMCGWALTSGVNGRGNDNYETKRERPRRRLIGFTAAQPTHTSPAVLSIAQ